MGSTFGVEYSGISPYNGLNISDCHDLCREEEGSGSSYPRNACECSNSVFYAEKELDIDCNLSRILYYYHPDYLGHNEYITDITGRPYQHFHYSAFGESLIEKNTNYGQFSSPYRFNGKDLDPETGNYYYGARYYNPVWGVWLGVDPLANEGPHLTPYRFSFNNPVKFVDPNGLFETEWNLDVKTGKFKAVSDKGGDKIDYYNIGTTNSEGVFESTETVKIDRATDGKAQINSFRIKDSENSTISAYNVPGTGHSGFFLEPAGPSTKKANQDQRIPEGLFNLESYSSTNYSDNFLIYNKDVSKDRKILIHTGNYPKNTLGCFLPGCSFGTDAVWSSGTKFKELRSLIKCFGASNVTLNVNNVIISQLKQ